MPPVAMSFGRPWFRHKAVNPATMFAQGAIFQIIIFHLKGDKNHQLSIMDFTILSYHPQFSIFHQRPEYPKLCAVLKFTFP
jgi:hypothetical protein